MAQPKRKTSKMKKRQRKASFAWKGIQTQLCDCGAPRIPHRACGSCGSYNGRQVIKAAN